jgi:predicted AlkP superfamily pyrophosphatase or phosphodiesterase
MKPIFIAIAAALMTSTVSIQAASAQSATSPAKPDLVVLVAIDQFGSLLFDKWRGSFKSGFKRIVDGSIVYSNAYQSHGLTETCAGHSTMLTGKHPGKTGIVSNEWYDTKTGKAVYCVADAEYSAAHDPKARKVGPTLLMATTLGDWLKEQQPGSRVVAVSGKDRASITMAGHRADGVFWYEDDIGFTTFVAAGEDGATKLAPLAMLNAKIQAESKTTPEWAYFEESCRSLEDEYQFGNVTWRSKLPPELPGEEGKPPRKVRPVHIIDPLTLEAARSLVGYYELGRRGVTDLLAVSLSATDFVGHGYGTQGPEMCDQMHRLDAQLGEFLKFLDDLGSKVLVVITGDHGGSDFPERLQRQGYPSAKRINGPALLASVNAELKQKLSLTANPLISQDLVQFYAVNEDGRQLGEPTRSQVIDGAVNILNNRAEVEEAFTLKDLLSHKVSRSAPSEYSLRDRYAQSVMAGRSGDIIVAYKSGVTTARAAPAQFLMGHAGPYRHDTAVPIIFWWHDAKPQTRILPIDTTAIAPTLANIVGVKTPGDLDGTCMDIGYPGAPNCKQ